MQIRAAITEIPFLALAHPDPENPNVDTTFVLLSHILSELDQQFSTLERLQKKLCRYSKARLCGILLD